MFKVDISQKRACPESSVIIFSQYSFIFYFSGHRKENSYFYAVICVARNDNYGTIKINPSKIWINLYLHKNASLFTMTML